MPFDKNYFRSIYVVSVLSLFRFRCQFYIELIGNVMMGRDLSFLYFSFF